MFKQISLKAKLLASFLAAFLLFCVLYISYVFTQINQLSETQAQQRMADISQAKAREIQSLFRNQKALVEASVAQLRLNQFSTEAIEQALPMVQQAGDFSAVFLGFEQSRDTYLIRDDGKPVNKRTLVKDNFDPTERPWYREAHQWGQSKVIAPFDTHVDDRIWLGVSVPVYEGRQLTGVYLADFTHDKFGTIISELPGNDAIITLADQHNQVILSSDDALSFSDPIADMLERARFEGRVTQHGRRYISHTIAVPVEHGIDWQLMISISEQEVMADAAALKQRAMMVSLVLVAVFAGLFFVVLSWVYQPILGLKRLVVGLSRQQKDLTQRIPVEGHDDIADISMAINSFLDNVQQLLGGIHGASDSLSGSSGELSGVLNESRRNAEQEQQEMEQIATAVTQLSGASSEVSRNAADADDLARSALGSVNVGQSSLEDLIELSSQIGESVTDSSQIVRRLKDFSLEIESVVDVIKGVSEQTNLLALNAAIEAARAGEQGRGFAVVADEVRSLAAQTQRSTLSIQEIIEKLQGEAERADSHMQKNAQLVSGSDDSAQAVCIAFNDIFEVVNKMSDINSQVAAAAEEQSSVTDDISSNVAATLSLVQSNVNAVAQSSAASEQLAKLAIEQRQQLQDYTIE
ncbi:methyl-accepting chemotaxis protein [Aliagarivorans marinus]|uniref:methyl-accepting chemotaxis protein n=1 Tax=Aliagarivorans marinus TaxID=561965 RepID=UPI000418637B